LDFQGFQVKNLGFYCPGLKCSCSVFAIALGPTAITNQYILTTDNNNNNNSNHLSNISQLQLAQLGASKQVACQRTWTSMAW